MIQSHQKLGSEPHLLTQCNSYSPGLSSVSPEAPLNLSVTAAAVLLTRLLTFHLNRQGHPLNILLSPECKSSDVLCLCRVFLWIPIFCQVKFTHRCVGLSHFPVSSLLASHSPSLPGSHSCPVCLTCWGITCFANIPHTLFLLSKMSLFHPKSTWKSTFLVFKVLLRSCEIKPLIFLALLFICKLG